MKKNKLVISLYILLILASIFIEYWIVVFSIFYFLGKHIDYKYENSFFTITLIVLGGIFFLFVIIFCFVKILKLLGKIR